GDLLVNVSVYVPESLSESEKKSLAELDKSDNFQPNKTMKEKFFDKFRRLFD
ncbi:MAG TPA: molecular chaperone DnaJ, partial [Parabacteroides sp.]|nr:molecular chaperone DnaJ [Parabacteroides sp.]